jgi:D-alanine-D-alanine ligase
MSKSVVVLMGGWSSEREVSLSSGENVARALTDQGYGVRLTDIGRDMGAIVAALSPRPDVVFNALHGRYGEDGCIQGVLEILGIPYTHSGVMASALAMDKPMAKKLFVDAGLPCAEGRVVRREEFRHGEPMARPYVVKPINEGSSVGVRIVHPGDNERPFDDTSWPYGEQVLIERYIPGREIQVAVMGDKALGAIEIRPKSGFYDYEAKYTAGKAEHLMPAPIPAQAYEEALDVALTAHRTLGCRGVTRADLRYDDTAGDPGALIMLEVNTQPGMTPLSLVPEQARHAGIGFGALVSWMVENAACGG